MKTNRDDLAPAFLARDLSPPVEWLIADGLTDYDAALALMESRVAAIRDGTARELVWLVEHPPLYTAGTSAKAGDLLVSDRFPVYATGRGGEYTYHGPGQRVAYVMLDLKRRREDRVGVWVMRPERPALPDGSPAEDKIAAIGIRLRKWVSFHGISINVEPELAHFDGIVPCGVRGHGVTSLVDLGLPVDMHDLDRALYDAFGDVFGLAQRPFENSAR